MSSLLIGCSVLKTYAPEIADGPPWWVRLARLVANEYRIHRGTRELLALDERTLRDIGIDRFAGPEPTGRKSMNGLSR